MSEKKDDVILNIHDSRVTTDDLFTMLGKRLQEKKEEVENVEMGI